MNKFYKGILGAAVLCAGSLTAGADTFTIPATQEEFETWTQVVPEGAESWKLITDNGPDAYASVVTCITDYDSQNPGQMLLVPQEYILKAGAKVKITPTAISACDYDGMRPWRCLQPTGPPLFWEEEVPSMEERHHSSGVKNRTIRSRYPKTGLTVSA